MQKLSKFQIPQNQIDTTLFPEKVLQFGTGILLRGLPDFFIDKANKQGIFKGRIVIVKSTSGSADEFAAQDNLFSTCVRGIENGREINENSINTAISRVLSANDTWDAILKLAQSPDLQVIISNTTEVGIQYVQESISLKPPTSFPAKLTAILWERFKNKDLLGLPNGNSTGFVIVPTELVPENGRRLKEIVRQLADFNQLGEDFKSWVNRENIFCNSLVDRIVTNATAEIKARLPYTDELAIQTEPYKLWAIEGGEKVATILNFAKADEGVIINENIDYYRERKLRILNGTHTISVCLGYLRGFDTVLECMQDADMQIFIRKVMLEEIVPSLSLGTIEQNIAFANEVLDRFANPYTVHYLLNITLQASAKMKMRNVATLFRYYEKFGKIPTLLTQGFAAYLVFMKPLREENGVFYGKRGNNEYQIKDDLAKELAKAWENPTTFVEEICKNIKLWERDLTEMKGFVEKIKEEITKLL
jgi:tagaturonate reductase